MPKIAFLVTEDWYFVSHRLPLGIAARSAGYDVVVITRARMHTALIESHGLRVLPFEMNRRGLNPFVLIREILQVLRIYLSERPDIVHHVALRPVLVGKSPPDPQAYKENFPHLQEWTFFSRAIKYFINAEAICLSPV